VPWQGSSKTVSNHSADLIPPSKPLFLALQPKSHSFSGMIKLTAADHRVFRIRGAQREAALQVS